MTFESWLKKQIDRDDPIGDLAKDFIRSSKLLPDLKTIEETFDKFTPCSYAWDAYEEAKEEYKDSK